MNCSEFIIFLDLFLPGYTTSDCQRSSLFPTEANHHIWAVHHWCLIWFQHFEPNSSGIARWPKPRHHIRIYWTCWSSWTHRGIYSIHRGKQPGVNRRGWRKGIITSWRSKTHCFWIIVATSPQVLPGLRQPCSQTEQGILGFAGHLHPALSQWMWSKVVHSTKRKKTASWEYYSCCCHPFYWTDLQACCRLCSIYELEVYKPSNIQHSTKQILVAGCWWSLASWASQGNSRSESPEGRGFPNAWRWCSVRLTRAQCQVRVLHPDGHSAEHP